MDLLIISLQSARHIKHLEKLVQTPIELNVMVGFILIVLAIVSFRTARDYDKRHKHKMSGHTSLTIVVMAFLGFFLFGMSYYSDVQNSISVGAADNVGCYHEIRELKRAYPYLQTNGHYSKKEITKLKKSRMVYTTSITDDAERDKELRKTRPITEVKLPDRKPIVSRKVALKRYEALSRAYRNPSHEYNGTQSLDPQKPHFWQYI